MMLLHLVLTRSIHKEEASSYPVGYVEYLDMYSLDFEEFLWANGMNDSGIEYVKSFFDQKNHCR